SPRQPEGKRRRQNDLTVEACRDYLRDRCTRSDLECKYAHPHQSVSVDRDSKVTACADSLRNNCFRGRTCRYYHPPPHIQEVVAEINWFGRPTGEDGLQRFRTWAMFKISK
uniref:C3H1-type domain-containing protein n=1 Tax=Aegilops tauschii subsp. strangulata TaxID=200361 RepID=A0A453C116_AEGTS